MGSSAQKFKKSDTQDSRISQHPKACTLHGELIGNLLAQLVYKDAVQILAQTVTLPPPEPKPQAQGSHKHNLREQCNVWYYSAILGPTGHQFCSGPLGHSAGIRTQDCRISQHPKACTLHGELIGNLLAQRCTRMLFRYWPRPSHYKSE